MNTNSGTLLTSMVIVSNYELLCKSKTGTTGICHVISNEISYCPHCDSPLSVYGSRKRTLIKEDGCVTLLMIRRLYCESCDRIHHELPECIVPYKRYESKVFEKVIENSSSPPSYPCEQSTAKKMKLWFCLLREYFESSLVAIETLLDIDIPFKSPLPPYGKEPDGWLKELVRILVNSGRWRQTRLA